ncbi:MAG: hypothetical protein JO168_27735 [Solirubrobacterales bacterium]|nr:hypothetical protein [Solirubrobacterales bacterium]
MGVHAPDPLPTRVELNRDGFMIDPDTHTSVAHRSDSSLKDIDLGDDVT